MKMNKKGFTLVEIMIVVAIIGVLAAIAIPNFVRYRKTAQMNACIGNLKQLQSACEQYRMKEGDSAKPVVGDLCGDGKYIKVTPKCPADQTKDYTFADEDNDYIPKCGGAGANDTEYLHALPKDNG